MFNDFDKQVIESYSIIVQQQIWLFQHVDRENMSGIPIYSNPFRKVEAGFPSYLK